MKQATKVNYIFCHSLNSLPEKKVQKKKGTDSERHVLSRNLWLDFKKKKVAD